MYFPTCQVRVSTFYQSCFRLLLPPSPPAASDCTPNCELQIRSQLSLPDLNGESQISVGNAGPQLRGPDASGHCRISAASARSQWALPRPQLREPESANIYFHSLCQKLCQNSVSGWGSLEEGEEMLSLYIYI